MKIIKEILLGIVLSLVCVSQSFPGNPTQFVTMDRTLTPYITGDSIYTRQVADQYGLSTLQGISVTGIVNRFRVFIPPGTSNIYIAIYEYGRQSAIVRFNTPPITTSIPSENFTPQSTTLEECLNTDVIVSENNEGKITMFNSIISGGVLPSNSGWIYFYITGGTYSSVYYNSILLSVYTDIYNTWYDNINWDRDVESATTYVYNQIPTPVPTPLATPLPTPTPTPTPENTSVLTVTPANKFVSKNDTEAIFVVSNTGASNMQWTASIISGTYVFFIDSGLSGINDGEIKISFPKNITAESRTGTIRVESFGALDSPVIATITQTATDSGTPDVPIEDISISTNDYPKYTFSHYGSIQFFSENNLYVIEKDPQGVISFLGSDLFLIERYPPGTTNPVIAPSFKKITWTQFLSNLIKYNNSHYQSKFKKVNPNNLIAQSPSGVVSTEPLGTSGTVLVSSGTTTAPSFASINKIITKSVPYRLGLNFEGEAYGYIVRITDTAILSLPSAVVGMSVRVIGTGVQKIVHITPTFDNLIVLHGVSLIAGHKISSSGNSGEWIELICMETGKWNSTGYNGLWIDND